MDENLARAREIATRFPRLRTRLETPAADCGAAPENTFEFRLGAILDGPAAPLPTKNPAREPEDHRLPPERHVLVVCVGSR
jgi:hypothetical protein